MASAGVYASEGTIKLMAVSEESGVQTGSIATLHLETREGSGRVFLETFPLSKADTQISMRFAKQVACNQLSVECQKMDFIYTLRANSAVIGGPSAGAAAAILTYAVLSDLTLPLDSSITGTINSGGLIGGVGGIKEKIAAAGNAGIKTVLIPSGKRELSEGNITTDLVEFGQSKGVKVLEVRTIDEAIDAMMGRKSQKPAIHLQVNPEYTDIMKNVSLHLCERARKLERQYMAESGEKNEFLDAAQKSLDQASRAAQMGDHYSAASFCFRAAINYDYLYQDHKNLSKQEIEVAAYKLKQSVNKFSEYLGAKKLLTLTELQAYMIVEERLSEAQETIEEIYKTNSSASYMLASATERVESAVVWSKFFMMGGAKYQVDNTTLAQSCEDKIRESEERYQYLQVYIPKQFEEIKKEIEQAGNDMYEGKYEMCLTKASKAKAEADRLINLLGTDEDQIHGLLENKLAVAKQSIYKSEQKGVFPILGYSYYEFANSLKGTDPLAAMLYAEYSLEFSNLDMYFSQGSSIDDGSVLPWSWEYIPWIVGGIILGMMTVGTREQH